jgi:hypothetical protein
VAHEDDSFGAVVAGMFDGWKCADNALVVRDLLVAIERDVEVDLRSAVLAPLYRFGIEIVRLYILGSGRACP